MIRITKLALLLAGDLVKEVQKRGGSKEDIAKFFTPEGMQQLELSVGFINDIISKMFSRRGLADDELRRLVTPESAAFLARVADVIVEVGKKRSDDHFG
jgi:hypothetical protein